MDIQGKRMYFFMDAVREKANIVKILLTLHLTKMIICQKLNNFHI
jgi:hypothetical protein